MIKVGILGTSGYVAKELIRLLLGHPGAKIECLVSESSADGREISSIFKEFRRLISKRTSTDVEALFDCDVVVTSKPDFDSLRNVPVLIRKGLRVIDMSAAYRFKDPNLYERVYKRVHDSERLLPEAVYGLAELHRNDLRNAKLVANPGCYPISVLLGCAPLIKNHIVDLEDIIVDAYSGISGAGANPEPHFEYLFCEMDGNMTPYKVCEHRHAPEMEQELCLLAQSKTTVTFVPHLAPIKQGILSSIYLKARKPCPSIKDLRELYAQFYKEDYFVRLMDPEESPSIRNVVGTNFCDVGIFVNRSSSRIVVISAIDNLIKGAAGQAIQNLNVMFDMKETAGLVAVNAEAVAPLSDYLTVEQLLRSPRS